jgi:hypothetical protein
MALVVVSLNELPDSDRRSAQIGYSFRLENTSEQKIRVLQIEPMAPSEAVLLEIKETSLADKEKIKQVLLKDLAFLLQTIVMDASEEQRKLFSIRMAASLGIPFSIIRGRKQWARWFHSIVSSTEFPLRTLRDAELASIHWKDEIANSGPFGKTYLGKLDQLRDLFVGEEADKAQAGAITELDPGETYTATYLFRFKRWWFEPRKYQISVKATFALDNQASQHAVSASASCGVSPRPWSLSLVAVAGSIMGIAVNLALQSPDAIEVKAWSAARSGMIVVPPVLAVIIFNVIEHTTVGKSMAMPLSWRWALLVGALCGIVQDRILAALKAFLV